jgi:hypothetical protein
MQVSDEQIFLIILGIMLLITLILFVVLILLS